MHSQSLKRIISWSIFIVVALFIWGCFDGAPHSNPLDPRSDNFENAGAVTGTVTEFYPPFGGLEQVEIRLSPGGRVTNSDASGRFDFVGIEPGRYTIRAERSGFAPAADTIDVLLGEQTAVGLRMDGLPVIVEAQLRTFHLSRWWPPPQDQFWLDVSVQVTDPDGNEDIENVFLEIPAFDLIKPLQLEQLGQSKYTTQLLENDIGFAVEAIVGRDINIIARDLAGKESVLTGQRISRIIEETPVANDPIEFNFASSNPPAFFWSHPPINYPYRYQVDVSRVDEGIPTLVQTIPDIPSDSLSITGTDALPIGEYIWRVSIIDEFGNQSRSREAGFRIQ